MITNILTLAADMTSITNLKIFDIDIINVGNTLELILRFFFNLLVTLIIVRALYYSIHKRKDYLFTYTITGTVIFLLCYLLSNVELQIGFAFGLFAIFGILRYRTSLISIKEMTYLFIVITIAVVNSLSKKNISYAEILFTNLAIIGVAYGLEKIWLFKHESIKTIIYENIALIKPSKRKELIEDIENRTGLKVRKLEIGRIDFLRDVARIRVYYYDLDNDINLADADEYYGAEDFEE